ncbi:hypothetical protein [Kordia jejudonensis]|uniref:hypothetical protein n=1 Tax=Kordia jejudonensis TaxID=1348245 RepID=UPI00062947EF|nr:hypothetical protein [Kordia jejudonensis]
MTRKLKNYSKLLLLSLILSISFTNCEKEQELTIEHETQLKTLNVTGYMVKGDSIRQTNKELDLFLTKRFEQRNQFLPEDVTSNTYGFTVNTNRFMQLNGDHFTNYIFTMTRNTPLLDGFENYMLTVFNDGRYMQVLIYHPLIDSDDGRIPDINGATVTYINDAALLTGIENSPCGSPSEEIIAWSDEVDCVYFNCTAGNNHSYGQTCYGSPGEQPFRICYGGWVVTGCVSGGGSSTGSSSTNPNDPFPPTDNGGNATTPVDPNTPDEPIPTVPFVPAWQEVVDCVNDGALGSFDNSLPLSASDIDWLQSQQGSVYADDIKSFIVANGCDESKAFVDEAIELVRNGGILDKENSVILDPSFVGTRAECAYNKIKNANGNLYKNTIDQFTNDPKYKLILTVGNCQNTDVACTDGNQVDINGTVKIIIEDLGEPTLELISTLLHEAIHAEIFRFVSKHQNGVDPNNKPRLLQLYQYYKDLAEDPNYNIDDPVTLAQHTYMAEKYVIPIAKAVREIDGNSHPLEYYMWYGWEGLEEYDFQNRLTTTLKQQYNQYQSIVNGSTSVNCN